MELFIRIVDGQPFEHPIFGDNFRQAFPDVDVNNLPPNFARFERIEKPNTCAVFEVEELVYQWVDGVVKDVWVVRPMTSEETVQKTKALTTDALNAVAALKDIAAHGLANAPTEEIRQSWGVYAQQLDAWVLVDPANPQIPAYPRINIDGTVLTTASSGSEPNVIG